MYEFNELRHFIKTFHKVVEDIKLTGFTIVNGELVSKDIDDDDFFNISDEYQEHVNIKDVEAESKGLEYYNQYRQLIDDAEKVLTDRELWILFERLDGKSQEEVGKLVNLSRERIRQLEVQLIKKICKVYK
ncbi:sigma factor-like helix-turn-helix DNA-binding protein [Macrococcus equi]|uniref:sigma factor-like helix-turn-helix DNA-binding protein n=1 Tax=Macrococcus equi TaxID=3395462 RepID=UPI0039BE4107